MSLEAFFAQPPVQRTVGQLDRSAFTKQIDLHALRIPAASTKLYKTKLENDLIQARRTPNVVPDPSSEQHRLLLFNYLLQSPLPEELQRFAAQAQLQFEPYTLTLDYDYWTADQVLRTLMPEELAGEAPSSYTHVGHIAHLNLREQYLPYKYLVGEVLKEKSDGRVKTVVNKLDTIDNEFRFFKMEVLAGEPDFVVECQAQDNCVFRFDFSKVYWNTRLDHEHRKIVASCEPNEVVVDGFAGVGPFAIPAAKKGCAVWANDLNPSSHQWLETNIKLNKVDSRVRASNQDARVYFKQAVQDVWNNPMAPWTPPLSHKAQKRAKRALQSQAPVPTQTDAPSPAVPLRRLADHFIMNLPASALEFLDAFRGLYQPLWELEGFREAVAASKMPLVHCYCFTKDVENYERDICQRASVALGHPVDRKLEGFAVEFVRAVAPNKDMYRLDFRLPLEVALGR